MIKRYNSFEEVDQQLRILRLQRDICSERIKMDWHQVISDIKFYPVKFIESFATTLQKLALVFALKKLRHFFNK